MRKNTFLRALSAFAITLAFSISVSAENASKGAHHAIGASFNIFGIGLFYTRELTPTLNIRVSVQSFSGDELDFEFSDIDYEGSIDSQAAGLTMDWYPFVSGWKRQLFFSGGAFYADVDYKGKAKSIVGDTLNIGGMEIDAASIDGFDLNVEGNDELLPYIGVGWGNKPRDGHGLAFTTEFGFTYQGAPDVMITASDPDNRITTADIRAEQAAIEDEIQGLSGFFSAGISYHF